jgi:hypothetical protein
MADPLGSSGIRKRRGLFQVIQDILREDLNIKYLFPTANSFAAIDIQNTRANTDLSCILN